MHLHHCTRCSEELAGNPEKERGDWFIRCLGCGARNIIALAGMSDVLGINWYTAFNGGMSVVSTTNDVIPLLGCGSSSLAREREEHFVGRLFCRPTI